MIRLSVEAVRGLKGAPASIILVLWVNRLGVSQEYLERNTGYTDKPISQALEYLREHGHVVKTASGWKLAGNDQQLPLGMSEVVSDEVSGEVLDAADPAPLQAEGPLGDASDITSGRNNSDSGADVLIVLKDSESNESIKTIRTPAAGVGKIPTRRRGAHLADVTRALLLKGLPAAADDPFPADLRAAVEALVATVHVDRRRAEQAVARSPWAGPKILEQVAIWSAYQRSPLGANLDAGKFPWLVAARIEQGEPCPKDTRGGSGAGGDRYDGYLQYTPSDEVDEGRDS